MPSYKIRDIKIEEGIKDILESLGLPRPTKVVMSVHVDVTEIEMPRDLTEVEQRLMYRELAKFDKRLESKADKP